MGDDRERGGRLVLDEIPDEALTIDFRELHICPRTANGA